MKAISLKARGSRNLASVLNSLSADAATRMAAGAAVVALVASSLEGAFPMTVAAMAAAVSISGVWTAAAAEEKKGGDA